LKWEAVDDGQRYQVYKVVPYTDFFDVFSKKKTQLHSEKSAKMLSYKSSLSVLGISNFFPHAKLLRMPSEDQIQEYRSKGLHMGLGKNDMKA
jgi:hypothetical protein